MSEAWNDAYGSGSQDSGGDHQYQTLSVIHVQLLGSC